MSTASVKHVIDNDSYGTVLESGAIRFERLLPGPIERVWDYLTVPEKRATWLAGGEMELHVGGRVMLEFHNATLAPQGEVVPDWLKPYTGPMTNPGRVTQVNRPYLLAFTWGDAGDGSPASEVVFELKVQGKDVMLALTHRRLTSNTEGLMVSCGWHVHVSVLIARLNNQMPAAYWSKFDEVRKHYDKQFDA